MWLVSFGTFNTLVSSGHKEMVNNVEFTMINWNQTFCGESIWKEILGKKYFVTFMCGRKVTKKSRNKDHLITFETKKDCTKGLQSLLFHRTKLVIIPIVAVASCLALQPLKACLLVAFPSQLQSMAIYTLQPDNICRDSYWFELLQPKAASASVS